MYSAYSGCSAIGSALALRTSAVQDTGRWSLNGIARHRINTKLIAEHWDDLSGWRDRSSSAWFRLPSVMRTLQIADRPTKLAQAVAELGRIDKTIHALTYIDDEAKRRRILNQLNKGGGSSQTGARGVSW
jgi:TnpA family transposase